jgi:Domain of unknown function (DUF4168)
MSLIKLPWRRLRGLILALWLGLSLGLAGAPAAGAAEAIVPEVELPAPIIPQPDASDIPSERVSKFVRAYLAVVDLISQRETDLQRAETETESLQLQEKIQAQAFALIEQAGLSRQEYWQLLGLANTDPDFRERVLAQVEETKL